MMIGMQGDAARDRVRDLRIERIVELVPPAKLLEELPLGEEREQAVIQRRGEVSNVPNVPVGTAFQFGDLEALAAADPTGNQLMDVLNHKMMHGTMSPQMRSTILTAVTSLSASNARARTQQAIYLIATSSQYQIQR